MRRLSPGPRTVFSRPRTGASSQASRAATRVLNTLQGPRFDSAASLFRYKSEEAWCVACIRAPSSLSTTSLARSPPSSSSLMSTPPTPPPSSPSPPPVTPPRSTRLLVSLSAPPGAPSARPNRFLRTPDRQRVLSYVRPGMAASVRYQAVLQESQAPAPHPPPPL
ncbi:hypothetical protein EXIGLDRAFT_753215, partial [Exidia glandulosa HHB12029]